MIVHFGDANLTKACLASFSDAVEYLSNGNSGLKASIVVVDNSSKLMCNDIESGPDIIILRPPKNLGYAGACYLAAARLSDTDALIFSNNDILVCRDSLLNLVAALSSLPDVGAVQPLVFRKSGTGDRIVDSIGLTFNPLMHGFNYCNWPIALPSKASLGKGIADEIFGVDGMFFAIKTRVWQEVDGWDPEFFIFNEDALLSWKLRLKGYRNYVSTKSTVYHVRGGSAQGIFAKKSPLLTSYYISRNKILSMLYLYDLSWLTRYLAWALLVEFAKNLILSAHHRTASPMIYYFLCLKQVVFRSKGILLKRGKIKKVVKEQQFLEDDLVLRLIPSLSILASRFLTRPAVMLN